jgi:ABC-type multidrug transport system fused ATPase/permease subunit
LFSEADLSENRDAPVGFNVAILPEKLGCEKSNVSLASLRVRLFTLIIFFFAMKEFKRLLKYLRPHRLTFFFAFLAMVFGALFQSAIVAMLVPIFDQFLPSAAKNPETLFSLQKLIPEGRLVPAMARDFRFARFFHSFEGVAEYFSSYLMAKIGQAAVLNLRQELYAHLLNQSASFFERHRTNYLVTRLVTSCSAIEISVASNMRDILRESLILVFFLGGRFITIGG